MNTCSYCGENNNKHRNDCKELFGSTTNLPVSVLTEPATSRKAIDMAGEAQGSTTLATGGFTADSCGGQTPLTSRDELTCAECGLALENSMHDCAPNLWKQLASSHLSQSDATQPLSLDKTESFCDWLDSKGDSLAPADSFETWLKEREDSI